MSAWTCLNSCWADAATPSTWATWRPRPGLSATAVTTPTVFCARRSSGRHARTAPAYSSMSDPSACTNLLPCWRISVASATASMGLRAEAWATARASLSTCAMATACSVGWLTELASRFM